MPFDGTGFSPKRSGENRGSPSDNAVSIMIIALAFSLLVMPISLAAFVDVVRYLRGS